MRTVNLFLTEDGVLKLGYYGLTTQIECYSIKKRDCEGVRSLAPEVFEGEYEMKSDVWSLGVALIEMIGEIPYAEYKNDQLPITDEYGELPHDYCDIKSGELADFLEMCFEKTDIWNGTDRWGVNELMNVSVMGWRLMSSIHL